MQKLFTLLLILLLSSCTSKEPSPECLNAGKFIMTLKNEEGLIKLDSASKKYTILFSPDGSLKYNTTAIPCNLTTEFQHEFLVRFDADFFELTDDSLKVTNKRMSMYIRKIEFL